MNTLPLIKLFNDYDIHYYMIDDKQTVLIWFDGAKFKQQYLYFTNLTTVTPLVWTHSLWC